MTPKQQEFCRQYLLDLNGKQAAIRAGYSAKTAEVQASKLLSNPKVLRRVTDLKAERNARTERDADQVVRRLWLIAEGDLRQAFNGDGTAKKPHEIPDDLAAALDSIEMGDTIKYKMASRIRALELLAKHHGLLVDRIEHSGNVAAQIRITMPDNGRDKTT